MNPEDVLIDPQIDGLTVDKALTTANNTTNDIFDLNLFEQGLRDYTLHVSNVYNFFDKVSWPGQAITIPKVTAIPTTSSYAEMASLMAASNSTYGENVFAMKSLHTRGEISGQLIAQAGGQFTDVLGMEVRRAAQSMVNKIEQLTISGDSASVSTDFDGLLKQITNIKYFDSVGDGSGTATLLTLAMLDEGLDAAPEPSTTAIIMNRSMYRRVLTTVMGMVRYLPENDLEINAGIKVPTYQGIRILRPHQELAALTNKIICVNGEQARYYVNEPINYNPLAKTKDSVDYFLKTYLTFVVEGPAYYHTVIAGVKAA